MNLNATTFSTREITVDIDAEMLRPSVQGHDLLILRVVNLSGPNGRPVTRSIRIPAGLLEIPEGW